MSAAQAPGVKGVVLCADDFALHASASAGIAKLARLGRISATSAMVLSPRWAQDAALLRELRERIDVGLHLDWTSAFAIGAGHARSLPGAMLTAALGGFAPAPARSVIERQLDAFETQWQAPPDFVDGHQHVQQFAGIRQALVQALVSRYGAQPERLPYLRISRAPPGVGGLKNRVIAALGAAPLEALARGAGIPSASALSGSYDFAGNEARYAALMAHWLQRAPPASIIMCHPAQAAEPEDTIGVARLQEFSYLGSADFAAALERARVQLVRGGGR